MGSDPATIQWCGRTRLKPRCPLCGETKLFKPGGFADICRGCDRAFGPFGGVDLGDADSPWAWPMFFVLIALVTFAMV